MDGERRERALRRMEDITAYYAAQHGVLAVAAFGSNAERERFDEYSDLDFLVFAEHCAKDRLLSETPLLSSICPIGGMQISAGDAVRLLFSDGVLCDFGIVTPDRLSAFPHGAGRYLWRREGWEAVDLSASEPMRKTPGELETDALFHLYTGLLRALRGEEAAAFYEIQVTAAQDVLALLGGDGTDAFSPLRRAEHTFQRELLSKLSPGYGRSKQAAGAMLPLLKTQRGTPLYTAVFSLLN